MPGDEGTEVKLQQVPTMDALPYDAVSTAPVVASAHLGSNFRAEGVNYPETPGVMVDAGEAYPAGTVMNDSTPRDDIN